MERRTVRQMCIGKETKDVTCDWWPGAHEGLASGTVVGVVAGDEEGEPGFSRRSRLTIAGGVRRDNWPEGRLKCRWPGLSFLRANAEFLCGDGNSDPHP
jgi:hypothetical protein